MTTNRPIAETRRSVMNIAWASKRSEPARAFADCLRGAWKFVKGMAAAAAKMMAKARRAGGRLNLSPSLIRSPSTSRLSGQPFGRDRDRIAGQMISRLGR
jgi:hypothetical protein